MSDRYIPAFITLLAGAITSIINIVNKVEVYTSLKRLLIVLIIFYVVGLITRSVLVKIAMKRDEKDKDEDIDEDEDL